MDADSTPPLKIHLHTGSSAPIRAPLTIDSDSEFSLSINDHMCSTTSSFNSTSSIDVNFLEENDVFVAHPDEEMVIESCRVEQHSFTRPFVKYPDENYVKNGNHFDKSAIFRPFVKTPNQEISRVGVPIAPLTSDCDSDDDSVESRRSLSSDGIPADGNVEKVVMVPKVGVFCSSYEGDDELQFDDVFSGDDIGESNEPITGFVRDETIDEDENKIEGLKISEMDEIGHYEQKEVDEDDTSIDSHLVPDSDNEIKIEIETSDEIEQGVFDRYRNEFEKTNEKERDEDDRSIDSHITAESDNEIKIKIETIDEIDRYRKEFEKTNEKEGDEDDRSIDSHIAVDSDNEIKIEIEKMDEIEQGVFDHYRNESKKTNEKEEEQREGDEDDTSFDSQRIDAQIIPNSDNEIEIENINGIDQECVFDYFNESHKTLGENEEEMLVKMKPIRPELLKLIRLLGLSNKDSTIARLLYKLNLGKPPVVEAEGVHSFDKFDFSLTILVIGKTGTGKSAMINSIFHENKASTDAFGPGTITAQEIIGEINGIRVRILDTPGLRDSPSERSHNRKILASIKRFMQKRTLDIVLYVDRLDTHSRDLHDSHLLRLITSSLGSSVWQNCIVVLTHAANSGSLPDEESGGFVLQRCRFIQEQISHVRATGQQTVNPVWLVENQNRSSYKHDQDWQTRFLLLCYSAKILGEASSVVEPSLNSLERGWFEFGDCLGHVIDLDLGLEGLMGSDRVWPVEPLGEPWNGGRLSRERKKACLEDYGFRVKVFGMKRWSLVFRLRF